jgi:ligand-binding sensor domain-containing protein/signal transduction histidine kinase
MKTATHGTASTSLYVLAQPPIFALLVLATAPFVHAQTASQGGLNPQLQITQYVHEAWNAADGLPQNSVYGIAQTADGYLWAGTQEGLARFDGVRFEVFDRARVDWLRSNEIWDVHEDDQDGLWIGTSGGGLTYLRDGEARTYSMIDGLSSDLINALYSDGDGLLWVGTIGGGVCRFDGSTFECLGSDDGLAEDIVLSIGERPENTLWFGTPAGLSRFEAGSFTTYTQRDGLPGDLIRALHPGQDGIWVGTDEGLAQLRDETVQTFDFPPSQCGHVISALFEDRSGALWIGTLDGGVCRLFQGQYAAFSADDGLTHDQIRSFYQDREGGVWIGTDGGGLHRLGMGKFIPITTAEGLSGDVIASVLEDRNGVMWIGTDGHGLNRLDDGVITHVSTANGLPSDFVYALHESRSGALWIGMLDGGLCRLDGERLDCFDVSDGLPSNNVWSIYEDRSGLLWMGTDAGLGQMEDGAFRTYSTADGLSADWITTLHEDREGHLWIGTVGGGLNRRRPNGDLDVFAIEDGLSSDFILALHEDEDGVLWIGTKEGGLCRLQDGAFACFTSRDGLFNDNVLQILEDDDENLWLASQKGISRVSKDSLRAYAAGAIERIDARVYGRAHGLKSSEFNGGTQPSAWRGRDGRLWFASMHGVALIDPASIPVNEVVPEVVIEAVRAEEEPVHRDPTIELPPERRDLQFDYTAPSFVATSHMAFRYKLEGYDDAWVDAGTRRSAFYTNLPSGAYTFRVQARNSDGLWNEEGAAVGLSIRPFFYRTFWFYLICCLALLAGGVGAHVGRTRYLRERERSLQQRVQEQTGELRQREHELERQYERQLRLTDEVRALASALTLAEQQERRRVSQILHDDLQQLLYGLQMKFFFFMEDLPPEDQTLRSQLGFLYHLVGRAITTTRQLTVDLSPLVLQGEGLAEALQWLQTYMREVHDLNVEVKAHGTISPPTDDMRVLLFQLVRELLFNVVKHAEVDRARVDLQEDEQELTIGITDEGIGFDPGRDAVREARGIGFGLYSVRERLGLFGGELQVDSAPGKGTSITIRVPHDSAGSAAGEHAQVTEA